MENISFELILYSGNAKSNAMEALKKAREHDFEEARIKLEEAQEDLVKAHEIQTQLLVDEARGSTQNVDILMVHAQDHLNGAFITIDLVTEIINLYKTVAKFEK
ncbi:MAG: PTS lactose/cellobiose transporter subunit IIA [Longicatena sp.]